nr:tripartite tricarboxylate transporter TctB family protein [Sedimentibacter sp.]
MKIRKLEKGEQPFILILSIFSLVSFIASIKMFMKDTSLSSQGAFPLLISSLLMIMSAIMIWEIRWCPSAFEKNINLFDKVKATFEELFPGKILPVVIMVIVYGIVLPHIGFIISTFLFLFLSMITLKKGNIKMSLTISAGLVVFILVLFQFIFKVILP